MNIYLRFITTVATATVVLITARKLLKVEEPNIRDDPAAAVVDQVVILSATAMTYGLESIIKKTGWSIADLILLSLTTIMNITYFTSWYLNRHYKELQDEQFQRRHPDIFGTRLPGFQDIIGGS